MADREALQKRLGISFSNPALLEQALVHSSYLNENPGAVQDCNERMEFLGDAVLGIIMAEKLYNDFPILGEGEMTRLRSALVCQDTLERVARAIELGEYLYLGRGEETSDGREKPTNLARALEAVIGAHFLDRDLSATKDFVLRLFEHELQKTTQQGVSIDYKSQLQEYLQAGHQQPPTYHIIEESGPDHDKMFTIEVRIGDTVYGSGTGKSKKSAEMESARLTLQRITSSFTR